MRQLRIPGTDQARDLPRPRCQEHGDDGRPPESVVRDGTRSLEVRWIFPGQMGTGVARWLDRFPVETESREDIYLVNPGLGGLSVKIRAGRTLEVKEYGGSRGTLFATGGVRGGMQSWQKWSFPFTPPSQGIGHPPGWRPVRKRRRIGRFSLADDRVAVSAQAPAGEAGCAVELTAVRRDGQSWWSLGFEATGPDELLRGALEAAAALVFAQPLPDGLQPGLDESTSYAEWLFQPP